ncbi:hypothetical protein A3F57_01000 [Candidatus Roizmanbacteria bacterium RIFCSPHIGHO2_12_FULL_36_11]|nr:MAG: hypothetical protein A3F57_01000 [Candidatus Roizmanbacteria bacterium RIFCSPHIGHO2_12_FULL_36_11]
MQIISTPIPIAKLKSMAKKMFGNMVKAVVDIEKGVIALDGELHADEEALLLEKGSKQKNLWGINLYSDLKEDWIEFDSIINIRPSMGNKSRSVDDEKIRKKILSIVDKLIVR